MTLEDFEKIYEDFADIEAQKEQEREFFGEILKDEDLEAELDALNADEEAGVGEVEAEAIPDAGIEKIDVPEPVVVQ